MKGRILIVDDDSDIRESLSSILNENGYDVDSASDGSAGFQKVVEGKFEALIIDVDLLKKVGLGFVEKVTSISPSTATILITSSESNEMVAEALGRGAYDYLMKPLEHAEVLLRLRRLEDHRQLMLETQLLRKELHREYDLDTIVGKSPAIERVLRMICQVAPADSTVLVTGKIGTEKELVAKAVHFNSPRSKGPFIRVNCGAILENLFDGALFGHEHGAFTGATLENEGFFKAAEGGSLFLDEVSEVPLQLQPKLLWAIESREVAPVGSSLPFKANVRLIAATNEDLQAEVERGTFREDLFHCLMATEIRIPSLAERVEDIPLLAHHFVEKYRKVIKKPIKGVSTEAIRVLQDYQWKGEVRELGNAIERAMIFSEGEYVDVCDLPADIRVSVKEDTGCRGSTLKDVMRDFEKRYITEQLILHHGSREETARTLKIGLSSLYRKIDELGIADS